MEKYKMQNKKTKFNAPRYNKDFDESAKLEELVSTFDWTKFDSFANIPLSSKTKNGLNKSRYKIPTDIQKQSIGYALLGNDVLGAAKTGSGKTLAFIIPMLECLYKNHWTSLDGVGALIITPTRELSYQIFEVLKKIGIYHDFSIGLIIGGKDLNFERKRMDRCNIVVCTPGRLLQHMDENCLFNCDNLKLLILDEADKILDMGFTKTMNAIFENLPSERQTLLFSATQTKSVKDLARLSLVNPIYVSSHENEIYSTPSTLTQSYIVCRLEDKINLLWSFLKQHNKQKIIVFLSSCKEVKFIYELFCHLRPGIALLSLYGTLHQIKRMDIYDKFSQSSRCVLFSTDIASRGLDFPAVNWVVQFDCPEDVNTYIHRVGRTARMENGGESLLILLPSEEESMIKQLNDKKIPIDKISVNPQKMFNIQRKSESFLAKDIALKDSAQRAFKAYLKNYFLMKDKSVFKFDQLNVNEYAKSLGLLITPRIRFIERKFVNEKKTSSVNNVAEVKIPNSKLKSEKMTKANFDNDTKFNVESEESYEDVDDLFKVKNVWRFDESSPVSDQSNKPELNEIHKLKKQQSKASIVKRLLKKNIVLNTKIVFNENSDPITVGVHKQMSEHVKDYDQVESGIDIEIAKKIMEDEDKVDKKYYRDIIKEKHRIKKLKLKEMKRKKKGQDFGNNEVFELAQNDFDLTQKYIDDLPDPDQIFKENSDSDQLDTGDTYQRENDKRIRQEFTYNSSDDCDDNELTTKKKVKINDLSYYENLALKLIK